MVASSVAAVGRRGNEHGVAGVLRLLGPSTRAEVAAAAGLSRATVSAAVSALLDHGLVVEAAEAVPAGPAGGRPAGVLRLSPLAGLAVGVDVGRSHLRVAVADLGHQVLAESSLRLARDLAAGDVLDRAADQVRTVLAAATRTVTATGARVGRPVGVGLGLPAPVDRRTGRVAASNIVAAWADVPFQRELADRLGSPVLVDNDANMGALAEVLWGAGRGAEPVAYIKAATGIGAGLVVDGRVLRGAAGLAGELGHLTLDEYGQVCRCGSRGCLELVAGGDALVGALRRTHGRLEGVEEVVALALAGDPGARRVVADAGTHLGVAAGGLVNLLNPERLVVGGELGRVGDLLLNPLRQALLRSAVRPAAEAVRVVAASLGERSEVLGAVAVVLREPESAWSVPTG